MITKGNEPDDHFNFFFISARNVYFEKLMKIFLFHYRSSEIDWLILERRKCTKNQSTFWLLAEWRLVQGFYYFQNRQQTYFLLVLLVFGTGGFFSRLGTGTFICCSSLSSVASDSCCSLSSDRGLIRLSMFGSRVSDTRRVASAPVRIRGTFDIPGSPKIIIERLVPSWSPRERCIKSKESDSNELIRSGSCTDEIMLLLVRPLAEILVTDCVLSLWTDKVIDELTSLSCLSCSFTHNCCISENNLTTVVKK